jgi:APA family basic amino acid/polyamine antiporter
LASEKSNNAAALSSRPAPGLRRAIGFDTAAALVVANTIGSGIFTTSGFVARDIGSPAWLLGLWIAGGLIELIGALAYSELSAAMPEAGGEYVYLREAYGPLAGYLSGWTSFFIGFSGAIAAATLAFVGYLHHFVSFVGPSESPGGKGLAIVILILLTTIHVVGLRLGGGMQKVLTGGTIAGMAVLIVAGLSSGHGNLANFHSTIPAHGSAAVSLIFIVFAYSGWNAAAYVAGEVKEPQRTLPRALLAGMGVVIALYLGMNLFYLYALPVGAMSGVLAVAQKASVSLFGAVAAHWITALLALAILSSASAMVVAGPRVYYAMARDGVFPALIGLVSPRYGTPARAMILQSAWSVVLILFFGTFEKVVIYTEFAVVIFSGLAVASVIVLRLRQPNLVRPFRCPGYPWLPVLYVCAMAWIATYTLLSRPQEAVVSLLVVGFGLPWYYLAQGRAKRA